MAKICGIENVAFVGKDGTEVRGKRIHFTEALVALDIEPLPCFLKRQGVQVENVRRRVLLLLVAKHEAEAAALLPDGVEGFP